MADKIMQVFYGNDCLPYKDKERAVHFPIVGSAFTGADNYNKIRFFVKEIGGIVGITWVANLKMPNGNILYQVLSTFGNEDNESYVELDISRFYTQIKGNIFISLNGCDGDVEINEDDQGIQTIEAVLNTQSIVATGTIKVSINYAVQRPYGINFNIDDYEKIIDAMAGKNNVFNSIVVVSDIDDIDADDYSVDQLFYCLTNEQYYKIELVSSEKEKVKTLLDSNDYLVRYILTGNEQCSSIATMVGNSRIVLFNIGGYDYLGRIIADYNEIDLYDLRKNYYQRIGDDSMNFNINSVISLSYRYKYLEEKAVQSQVYGTNNGGTQATIPYGSDVSSNKIVQRDSSGQINVPFTPTQDAHSASKKYVDDKVAEYARNEIQVVDITLYPTLQDFLDDDLYGEEGIIYLYPINTSESPTFESGFYRYVWENNNWLSLGTTDLDLSGYHRQFGIVVTNGNYSSLGITSIATIPANTNVVFSSNIKNAMVSGLPIYGVSVSVLKFNTTDDFWVMQATANVNGVLNIWIRGSASTSWNQITPSLHAYNIDMVASSNYSSLGIDDISDIPLNTIIMFASNINSNMVSNLPAYGNMLYVMKILANGNNYFYLAFQNGTNYMWVRATAGVWTRVATLGDLPTFTLESLFSKTSTNGIKNQTLSYQLENILTEVNGYEKVVSLSDITYENNKFIQVNGNVVSMTVAYSYTSAFDVSTYQGKQIIARTPVQPDTGVPTYAASIAFFDASNNFISAETTLKMSQVDYEIYKGAYKKVVVPSNAKYGRCNIRTEEISMFGIYLVPSAEKMPYQSGVISFTVPVNQNSYEPANGDNTIQDSETISYVGCALKLPSSYSKNGAKTKLVMCPHGAGGYVNGSTWNGADSKQFLLDAGYAIFDVNGSTAYADEQSPKGECYGSPRTIQALYKAYKYIVDNYNVEEKIFICTQSMGGLATLNFTNAYPEIVQAIALLFPCTDLYNQAWLHPWSGSDQKVKMAKEYFFDDQTGATWEGNKVIGYNPIENKSLVNGGTRTNNFQVPIKIWHGTSDAVVSYQGSVDFINALKQGGNIACLRPITNGTHSFESCGTVFFAEALLWLKRWK